MILELHLHTKFSFDSISEPYDIIRTAQKKGLNGIAVTDHGTIAGAKEISKINNDPDFKIILGTEIATEAGDIIGLFITDEIKSRNSLEVIDEIHAGGGIAILPHPYSGHNLTEDLIQKIDIMEIFNGRCTVDANKKAGELAKKYYKPVCVGSDAHFLSEIGRCRVIIKSDNIKEALLNGDVEFVTDQNPKYFRHFSQIIKSLKYRQYHKVPVHIIRAIKCMLFE